MSLRRRIYEIIEVANEGDKASRVYDCVMIVVILVSLIPLAIKDTGTWGDVVDKICVAIFVIDYILRLATADFKFEYKRKWVSFIRYPVSFLAIIDLISILPSFVPLNSSFKMIRVVRLVRAFRVFRVFRGLRYSRSIRIISNVLRNSRDSLIAVCSLAIAYILIAALVIFNVEPDSFKNFFEAVYWATVSLTTVGYGDIYPITTMGRIITMASSIFGIAIVALPAGIITAGYMKELEKDNQSKKKE